MCIMKCWLSEWLDFLFPQPVEQDMDGDKLVDIPAKPVDSDAYLREVDTPVDIPVDIPEMYLRNIPVLEPDTMTPKSADAYVRSKR